MAEQATPRQDGILDGEQGATADGAQDNQPRVENDNDAGNPPAVATQAADNEESRATARRLHQEAEDRERNARGADRPRWQPLPDPPPPAVVRHPAPRPAPRRNGGGMVTVGLVAVGLVAVIALVVGLSRPTDAQLATVANRVMAVEATANAAATQADLESVRATANAAATKADLEAVKVTADRADRLASEAQVAIFGAASDPNDFGIMGALKARPTRGEVKKMVDKAIDDKFASAGVGQAVCQLQADGTCLLVIQLADPAPATPPADPPPATEPALAPPPPTTPGA